MQAELAAADHLAANVRFGGAAQADQACDREHEARGEGLRRPELRLPEVRPRLSFRFPRSRGDQGARAVQPGRLRQNAERVVLPVPDPHHSKRDKGVEQRRRADASKGLPQHIGSRRATSLQKHRNNTTRAVDQLPAIPLVQTAERNIK